MKKTSLFLGLLVLSSALFAEGAAVGGWGRAVLLPYVTQSGGDAVATVGNSYGNTPEFDVNIVGSAGSVGFEYDFKYTGKTNIETGNNAYVWVTPAEGLRLAVGTLKDWTLQSNGTFGGWDFLRFSYTGENLTFSRVNIQGAELSYSQGPLFVYAALDNILYGSAGGPAAVAIADGAKNASAGGSWQVEGFGALKFQALGYAGTSQPYQILNAAVDVTGMENLWASVGVYLNTDSADQAFGNDSDKVKGLFRADAAASYQWEALKLNGLVEYATRKTGDTNLEFGFGVDYEFDDGIKLLSDVRFLNPSAALQQLGASSAATGVFLGVNKSLGSGNVGIGVAYSTSTFATWGNALVANDDPDKAHFAIPVRVDYSF